ncbi:MAG: winged helix-turn-helix domain-containing protein, partial [Planctomycetes bacterium]|nr:winged helix-turn-helix domain-containing protein [Planctomycetota bacterium]
GDAFVGDRTIDTHVLNLRHKVERDPKRPAHLLTVHGIGYRLVDVPLRPEAP